jgi:hypothetical protein
VLLDPTRLTSGRPAEIWAPSRSLKLKFNEAVSLGNYVYGLDDGILACIDAKSGERRWKGGRYRFGHVLLWQNMLLIQAEDGAVALVEATPEAFREITRFQPLDDRTWNVPAAATVGFMFATPPRWHASAFPPLRPFLLFFPRTKIPLRFVHRSPSGRQSHQQRHQVVPPAWDHVLAAFLKSPQSSLDNFCG